MCLFLGIILTPGTTSPGRGRVALTVADEDDDGDSDLSAAEGDVLVEDRFTGQEFEDADTQLELIIDEDPADDVDGSVPVTTAIEAQDLKPAAAPTMPPSLSVLDTDVVLALSTDCTCVIDTMDDDLDAAETPSRPFADLPLFAGVMMYASSAESDAAVGESIQEPPVISIAAREPELLSRIADEDTQPVTDAEPKPDVVESVAAPVDNSTDVDDAEVDNEYEDEYENAADDVDDADEDEDEDDEYEWVYVDEDGNEIPEDEADEYEEIDEEDAEYEDDEFDDDDELDDEEPEDEAIAAKK